MRQIVGIGALLALVVYMSCGAPGSEEANPFKTGAEKIIEEKIAAESGTSSSSTSSSGSTSSSSGSSTSSTSSSSGETTSSTSSSSGETTSSTSSSSSSGSSSTSSSGGGLGSQSSLVIARVFGGGGNTPNAYAADFVELFNPTTSAISLNGLTIQYGGAASDIGTSSGTTFQNHEPLPNVTVAAGSYYLIALSNATAGTALPTPDFVVNRPTLGTPGISASATAGKIALVNSTSGLVCGSSGTPCDSTKHGYIIDLVTYGTASTTYFGTTNLANTDAAPTLSTTAAASRKTNGCTRSSPRNPAADFEKSDAPFTARNSATTAVTCP